MGCCSWSRTAINEESIEPVPHELLAFQRLLTEAAETGFSHELPGANTYALLFFNGLRRLVYLLAATGRVARLRDHLLSEEGRLPLTQARRNNRSRFELARLGDRAETLLLASKILGNWPTDFVNHCRTARMTSWHFQNYSEPTSYWLSSVVQWYLYDWFYSPNKEEQEAVRQYLESQGVRPTQNEINRMLGAAYRPLIANDPLHVRKHTWNPRGVRKAASRSPTSGVEYQ
jgi:hypothetical protein